MNTRRTSQAFTRIELLAIIAAAALLGALALPVLGASRGNPDRASCFNNLRQIGLALSMYADEHDGLFPERRTPSWAAQLQPYYRDTMILRCPADDPNPATFGNAIQRTNADGAPRSYVFNGWNDYFEGVPWIGATISESAIQEPSHTITFGEKLAASGHFWFDYWAGDDYEELEQGRHFRTRDNPNSGSSNFAFADGSVQLLPWGKSLDPINLWFIDPVLRQLGAF